MPDRTTGPSLLNAYFRDLPARRPALYHEAVRQGAAAALDRGIEHLHRVLRDDLEGTDAGQELLRDMVEQCSIWFPHEVCDELPVLLPHVLRDNTCRKEICSFPHHVKRSKGTVGQRRDMWSTPSPQGYVRDDNSLIKALVQALVVDSNQPALHGKRLGAGFVACHIVPMSKADDPWVNSYVPNLAWLPKPLDLLSDRYGSFVSRLLAKMSAGLYGDRPRRGELELLVFEPMDVKPQNGATPAKWRIPSTFLRARRSKILSMTEILEDLAAGRKPRIASRHTHYDLHLSDLRPEAVAQLALRLRGHIGAP